MSTSSSAPVAHGPRGDAPPARSPRAHDPCAHGIVLAPMEGVIDAPMRALLTSLGGYARTVTEFVRVCDARLPERVFLRLCPELERGGTTPCGVPVYVQLLGSDGPALAANAVRAAGLGAPGIDLNFGCPAKTVNRSQGGSVLLREPARVGEIVAAVRDALPGHVPLTVKIRLGYEHPDDVAEIAARVRAAGADELAVHARTKADGYRPPARWPLVAPLAGLSGASLVGSPDASPGALPGHARTRINGEIWNVADARAARAASGCRTLMLGRGALAAPDLAARIALDAPGPSGVPGPAGMPDAPPMAWERVADIVCRKFVDSDAGSPRHVGNRTKQWLGYLSRTYPEARQLFLALRPLHDVAPILAAFAAQPFAAQPFAALPPAPVTMQP